MFGPPKRQPSGKSASSSASSNLRRPSSALASTNGSGSNGKIAPSNGIGNGSSTHLKQQASQSSLLASRTKSTSRSSILSDTTASICSSSAGNNKQHQSANPTRSTTTTTAKSPLSRSNSLTSNTSRSVAVGGGRANSSVVVIRNSPLRSGPFAAGSVASSSPSSTRATTTTARRPSCSSTVSSSSSSAGFVVGATSTAAAAKQTAAKSSASSRTVPTLAMSLRDKDQQIKLLIKERDEQKFQAELMSARAREWEEKFQQSEVEKSNVTSEADDEVVELRRLTQELEDENRKLVERLTEREQVVGEGQFKLVELECERAELKRQLADLEDQLRNMEQERVQVEQGKPVAQLQTERSISKAKYEREIEDLKEKVQAKEEQMIQLRTSLEMRKNEVANLQSHSADLERKLKIESERSERHLKRIDEVNLELKAAEAKLAAKAEGNQIYENQVKQLRQELRATEEKLEQISLARKKDLDVLHGKLVAARRGSTTPTSPQPYKTPTPQDEIVRLQMEIRDLKDQLIDREAELDCNRRDLEVMRRKMETRTLEVDCNNQELARRCQDLLEQNRQSEDTVKQLLKSTTEHSSQLMHATEDLKEANGKCIKLREEINQLEVKLEEQMRKCSTLVKENATLKQDNESYNEQVTQLRQQVDNLNSQLSELCQQLDIQSSNLHKDREALAEQLSQQEIELAQLGHDLATSKQDLRTSRLQTQEVQGERDRLRADLEVKEKYIGSRNDIIETLRHELEDSKRALAEYKQRLEELRQSAMEADKNEHDELEQLRGQLEVVKVECAEKSKQVVALKEQCDSLQASIVEAKTVNEEEELRRFDKMRQKHSLELDSLKERLADLECQLEQERSSTLKAARKPAIEGQRTPSELAGDRGANDELANQAGVKGKEEYEGQIEFLNSLVVDMQKKCDDYKSRLAQLESQSIMKEFDTLIQSNPAAVDSSRSSTLVRRGPSKPSIQSQPLPQQQPPPLQNGNSTLKRVSINTDINTVNHYDSRPVRISGRPFCDICQVYDLHHTVYCPKVREKLDSRNRMDGTYGNGYNNNDIINNNNNASIFSRGSVLGGGGGRDLSMLAGSDVEDIFREYERSIEAAVEPLPSRHQFASLRRPIDKPPRPYCDHCDLFGHTVKSCNSLSQT